MKNLLSALILFTFIFIGISCQKEEEKSPEVATTEDDATLDLYFDAVFQEVEDATAFMEDEIYGGKKSSTADTCKVVTVDTPSDTSTWPKTITIDYGDGCVGLNMRVRKGKVVVVVNSPWRSPNYSRTVNFQNFYIDNFKVEGTKTIARAGFNDAQHPLMSISLDNGKVTSPEGKVVTREFTRIREWTVGYNTPRIRLDDEYLITGSASGTDRNGVMLTREIIDPLHVKHACPWIMSGTIKTTKEGKPDVILDYGDDVCDRIATVTAGDKTYTITLRR